MLKNDWNQNARPSEPFKARAYEENWDDIDVVIYEQSQLAHWVLSFLWQLVVFKLKNCDEVESN